MSDSGWGKSYFDLLFYDFAQSICFWQPNMILTVSFASVMLSSTD